MAKSEGYLLSCPEFTLFSLGGKKIAEDVLSALWVEIGFDWDDITITKAEADISFHKEELLARRKLLCQEADELEEDLRFVLKDIDRIDELLEELNDDTN